MSNASFANSDHLLDRAKEVVDTLFPNHRDAIRNLRDGQRLIMFQNECEGMYECDHAIFPLLHITDEMIQNPQ